MSDLNKTDLIILREQFPSLFIFNEWFSEEEQADIERLDSDEYEDDGQPDEQKELQDLEGIEQEIYPQE